MPFRASSKMEGWIKSISFLCALSAVPAFAAGEALQGAAAIVGAVGSIVAPAIQAAGQAAVAGIQAGASVAMTRIAADTSMYISAQNSRVALEQTWAAERINAYNQYSTTQRLDKQLTALREARESAASIERERLKNERELNDMRIQLSWQQAEANYKLAQMGLSAQLVQAGLSTGFIRKNSGANLTNTPIGGAPVGGFLGQRLLSSISPPPFRPPLAVARTQIGRLPVAASLAGGLRVNGFVRGSSAGSPVRVASAAPMLQSDLASFQQSVPAPGESYRNEGRSRASVLVGAQGHTGYAVSGRPVMGRPSGRAFADR